MINILETSKPPTVAPTQPIPSYLSQTHGTGNPIKTQKPTEFKPDHRSEEDKNRDRYAHWLNERKTAEPLMYGGGDFGMGFASTMGTTLKEAPLTILPEIAIERIAVEIGILRSFDDLTTNPKAIWGKSADEVGEILGPGWKKEPLNTGKGWKYTDGKQGLVSFSAGDSRHGNVPYYKINSGASKNKVVSEGYIKTEGETSNIFEGAPVQKEPIYNR